MTHRIGPLNYPSPTVQTTAFVVSSGAYSFTGRVETLSKCAAGLRHTKARRRSAGVVRWLQACDTEDRNERSKGDATRGNVPATSDVEQRDDVEGSSVEQKADVRAVLDKYMPEVDQAFNAWIGSSIPRWEWYEGMRKDFIRGITEFDDAVKSVVAERKQLEDQQRREEDRKNQPDSPLPNMRLVQDEPTKDADTAVQSVKDEMDEMDRLAESWIGTNLSRWEWYERLQSRRTKLSQQMEDDSKRFDEDLNQMRRLMMEIDEMLGTGLLDTNSNISATGWLFLTLITGVYIGIGYTIVHVLVGVVMSLMAFYNDSYIFH